MDEQTMTLPCEPSFASAEVDLVGTLFGFYQRTMTLLPQSSLDGGKVKVVAERIKHLMDNATDDVKRSRDWNVAGRLDSAYEEVKRLVVELSDPHGGDTRTPTIYQGAAST